MATRAANNRRPESNGNSAELGFAPQRRAATDAALSQLDAVEFKRAASWWANL
jgi:hypothetical protein